MGECETVNVSCSGETSWFGFAEAIVDGLRKRNLEVRAERVIPIKSEDYPTRAARPRNSRLESTKAREMFSIRMPAWQDALDAELAALAQLRGITIVSPVPAVVDRFERNQTEG
jgi:dTDP-4-dehydrorhamnose reductase